MVHERHGCQFLGTKGSSTLLPPQQIHEASVVSISWACYDRKLFQILFTKTQVKVTEPWPQPQCPSPQFPWSLLPDAHPGHTKAVGDHSIGSLVFCYIVVLQGRVGETCQERFQVLWYVTYMCWSFEWNCISKQPHFSTHVFFNHLSLSSKCRSTRASLRSSTPSRPGNTKHVSTRQAVRLHEVEGLKGCIQPSQWIPPIWGLPSCPLPTCPVGLVILFTHFFVSYILNISDIYLYIYFFMKVCLFTYL